MNILVPTDFSPCADKALHYAIDMARRQNATLHVLYVMHLPILDPNMPPEMLEKIALDAHRNGESELRKRAEWMKQKNVKHNLLLQQGLVVDEILDITKEMEMDLVIMGTTGAGNIMDEIFGSKTQKVLEQASCTVIAIPESAEFSVLDHIVYATDYEPEEDTQLQKAIEFAKAFDARISFLHVDSALLKAEIHADWNFDDFQEKIKAKYNYPNIDFHLMENDSISEGVDQFAHNQKADLIAITVRKRNLFDRLFHHSLTRKLAYHSNIPVISFR